MAIQKSQTTTQTVTTTYSDTVSSEFYAVVGPDGSTVTFFYSEYGAVALGALPLSSLPELSSLIAGIVADQPVNIPPDSGLPDSGLPDSGL